MRPNILFIMSDDHAAEAISAFGAGVKLDLPAKPSRDPTGTYSRVNGVTTLESTF